ncbi:hypothetical protein [Chromobacterium subtsugae]|uniref:hypothetical protein n=1 Tax=Chromobacterium subtsugae TaxID=251747 RepID=UPI00069A352D|nr:hypothetical protein [Chromobacterium subtsugae]
MQNFALLSASPLVKFKDLAPVAGAVTRQVNGDFFSYWNINGAVTSFTDQAQVPPDYYRITVVQGRPEGLLGIHHDDNGQPYAYVSDEGLWSVTVSHEVLEMLVDPTFAAVRPGPIGDKQVDFLVEICDPCQAVAYSIDGISVSDFVTPEYYDTSPPTNARFTCQAAVTEAFGVAAGGYLTWMDPSDNMYYSYSTDGTNSSVTKLGLYPAGMRTTPRAWVDSILRRDTIQWPKHVLDELSQTATAHALAAKQHARHWKREIRLMRKAMRESH